MKYYKYNGGLAQVPEVEHDLSIQFLLAGAMELSWSDYLNHAKYQPIQEKDDRLYFHKKYLNIEPSAEKLSIKYWDSLHLNIGCKCKRHNK